MGFKPNRISKSMDSYFQITFFSSGKKGPISMLLYLF